MSSTTQKSFAAGVLTMLVLIEAGAARAQSGAVNRENARALWADGNARRAQGDHKAALKSFEAAHALVGLPATGIEVAREREAAGLLIEARDMALSVARMTAVTPDDERAAAEAAALYKRLEPRIPSIEIAVSGIPVGTPYRVRIDGTAIPDAALTLPWRVNPGAHTIAVGAEGHRVSVQTVTVPESTKKRVEVRLSSLSESPGGEAATIPRPALATRPPEPIRLYIKSKDSTVGLYHWFDRQLVCRAPCGSLIDPTHDGTSFYFEGLRTPRTGMFSLDRPGIWTATVQSGSRAERILGGVLIGLGGAAGLTAILSGVVAAGAGPGTNERGSATITTIVTALSSVLLTPIGVVTFIGGKTTFTIKPVGAP